ncbi:MAG: zinc metallopeptidase [Bacilli bacterium]
MIIIFLIILIHFLLVTLIYFQLKNHDNNKITGMELVTKILGENNNFYIVLSNTFVTNYYDVNKKTIKLSKNVYSGTSFYSLMIASFIAHSAKSNNKNMKFLNSNFNFINYFICFSYLSLIVVILLGSINVYITIILLFIILIVIEMVTYNEKKLIIDKVIKDIGNFYTIENKNVFLVNYTYYINCVFFKILSYVKL